MDYQIRMAATSDKEKIYALFTESARPYVEPIWGWDEAYQSADFDASFVLSQFQVIEVDRQFAGFLQTYVHEDVLELCEIHLRPELRGRGIGSSVINQQLAGDKVVRTGCFKANTQAKALYQRLGFREMEETATHFLLEYRRLT